MNDPTRRRSIFFLPVVDACREPLWQPKADVYQAQDGWIVKFDLAGIGSDDLALCHSGCRLTVSGVRRDWLQEEVTSCHGMEIAYSRFERSIELPVDLDGADVESEYRDGMLVIRIRMQSE
jgi:HSP20 family protein